jgi:hypothetical protein
MTIRSVAALKANMPLNAGGAVSVQDIHDILDTIEDRTTQQTLTRTTDYVAVTADNRRRICFTGTSPAVLYLHQDIPAGWECLVGQTGTGIVTFSAVGGSILSKGGHSATSGQNAVAYLLCVANAGSSPQVILTGDTATAQSVTDAFSSGFSSGFS